MTPREYLHQHFGTADRRWIDSLTDERCFDVYRAVHAQGIGAKVHVDWANIQPSLQAEEAKRLVAAYGAKFVDLLNSGEYPNWR